MTEINNPPAVIRTQADKAAVSSLQSSMTTEFADRFGTCRLPVGGDHAVKVRGAILEYGIMGTGFEFSGIISGVLRISERGYPTFC